ncbi:hypothetical protein JRI60_02480 [Archangium violaceum]|uniref:hypothetical protein n=1 Tax=Archangium violaceum TaxID=83451 RepID=UPI00195286CB|nr:hypothetical protein [Archangium violaceum]QRN97968.1 hypothetical protein JRI60_02480 [Archangium violaceum]
MRPIDICSAVLVSTGNRALREPSKTRWDAVEELMGLRLRYHSPFESRVTLVDPGGEHLSFEEWLENRPSPSARLWLAPFPPGGASDPTLASLDPELRDAIGNGSLGFLLYSDGQRIERFVPREVQPLLHDIAGPQLHAFILSRKNASGLTELLARELNLGLESLEAYLSARSPHEMQDIVERFMSTGAMVEYASSGEAPPDPSDVESWNAFFSPSPGTSSLSFEFLYAGSGSEQDLELDLASARESLTNALEAMRDFSQKQGLRSWSKLFRRALLRLSLEPQPLEDLSELLLLNGLPSPSIQLALCAAASDVFGGIGAWNDLDFPGEAGDTYRSLSARLLSALRTALRASLNSSAL